MWPETSEQVTKLRTGLTTGTCATACCVAAAIALFSDTKQQPKWVDVTLPKGALVQLEILSYELIRNGIKTSTIKDAGDDPDVTHGATIFVELMLMEQKGVQFMAAHGVGTVTRAGLSLAIGEAAINPVPRQMMTAHLLEFAQQHDYKGGFLVAVGVENGQTIAQKTMNPRLGIEGGLSILGTTGIVRPFSCAAYIASIHQGIDVARSNKLTHIAATTGNSSELAIKRHYAEVSEAPALEEMALIEMGDFVGAVLKHIRKVETQKPQLTKISVCGGFGKLTKLANEHLDLNSRVSSIDFAQLAQLAAQQGADSNLQNRVLAANTSLEALSFCQAQQVDLAHRVCQEAVTFMRRYIPNHIELEVWAIDRQGGFVGKAVSFRS
ncbi:cobalt-precorrin-5B (C(1))-methyltransferase [Marinomonas agarivorans]|nr:cobalt-precorrin-5B (C(1))-methyltransferase [Marinomonas agarivorans]